MTRKEEIKEVAGAYAIDEVKDTCNPASKRGLLYAGFIEGAVWADEHSHWISVEDKLPPKKSEYDDLSNNVLATDGKEIYESVYNHDFEEWFTHDMWGLDNITHWITTSTAEERMRRMKDIDERFWYKMQSQQHHRRNISGIYIFDKFPDEEKRSPTCIEDCQQTTRRKWVMEGKDTEYAKQAITMIYDAFLKLCDYLRKEGCIEDKSFADLTDMANRAKEELGYNWALHELASHLDVACDKLAMLADTFGVVRGGEE